MLFKVLGECHSMGLNWLDRLQVWTLHADVFLIRGNYFLCLGRAPSPFLLQLCPSLNMVVQVKVANSINLFTRDLSVACRAQLRAIRAVLRSAPCLVLGFYPERRTRLQHRRLARDSSNSGHAAAASARVANCTLVAAWNPFQVFGISSTLDSAAAIDSAAGAPVTLASGARAVATIISASSITPTHVPPAFRPAEKAPSR